MQVWTDPGVVTSFKAKLAPGTTAELRAFVRLAAPANATIGLELQGSVGAITGKVDVHGDFGSDEVRFRATFEKHGTAKGYRSLWYTRLGISSSGRMQAVQYLGASNRTATK